MEAAAATDENSKWSCGSHQWEQQMELEELEEEEEMSGEHGQADCVMEQVIKFMWGAFENLKACKTLAQGAQPNDQPLPDTATDRVTASTAVGSTRARSAAAVTSITPIPRGANQHGPPVGLTSVRRRNRQTPPLGMTFDGDPQQFMVALHK